MKWILVIIINVVVAIVVPGFVAKSLHLSLFEFEVIAGLLFIALNVAEMLYYTKELLEIRKAESRTWSEQDAFDKLLASV